VVFVAVLNKAVRFPGGSDRFVNTGAKQIGSGRMRWPAQHGEEGAMALKHESEYYVKWTHMENGNVITRRLHRIEIQAKDGRLYALTGEHLPDALMTNSGHTYKGRHIAQILLRPDSCTTYEALCRSTAWPNLRDVVNLFLGFLSISILRFVIALFEAV
jgi:hypothetical protein